MYLTTLSTLSNYNHLCTQILHEINEMVKSSASLRRQHSLLMQTQKDLQAECESIMREKAHLTDLVDNIHSKLKAHDRLNEVAKEVDALMSKSGTLHTDIVQLMFRVDECVPFILHSETFLGSDRYRVHFQQTQSRALSLVKLFVVSNLRSHTSALVREMQASSSSLFSPSLSSPSLSTPSLSTPSLSPHSPSAPEPFESSVFTTMRRLSRSLRPVLIEIEMRIRNDMYSKLMDDCQYAYFHDRKRLLLPLLSLKLDRHLSSLAPSSPTPSSLSPTSPSSSLAEFLRRSCADLVHIAQMESQLLSLFFSSAKKGFDEMLGSFGMNVYEVTRPVLLKQSLDDLCTVAGVLKIEIIEEQIRRRPELATPILSGFRRILQDIQERLSFLVEIFIRDEVTTYVPTPNDLDYPNILQLREEKEKEMEMEKREERREREEERIAEKWYPPVGRTLLCLSKIYLILDKGVFQEIASDAVGEVTASLISASAKVSLRSGIEHASLFLIRHLIILRDQISPFDIDFSKTERSLDFSESLAGINGIKSAVGNFWGGQWGAGWKNMMGRTTSASFTSFSSRILFFFPIFISFPSFHLISLPSSRFPFHETVFPIAGALVASTPKVKDCKSNTKRDVEKELMRSIDQYVSRSLPLIAPSLFSFLQQVSTSLSSPSLSSSPRDWGDLPFASYENVRAVTEGLQKSINAHLPVILSNVSLYLSRDCPHSHIGLLHTLASALFQQVNRFYSLIEKHVPSVLEREGVVGREEMERNIREMFPKGAMDALVLKQ